MPTRKTPVWKKKNPTTPATRKTLTAAEKAEAKRMADAAGRRYPNLVDNMRVAARRKTAPKAPAGD